MSLKKRIGILPLICLSVSLYSQSCLDSTRYIVDSLLVDLKVDHLNNIWYIYSDKIIRQSDNKAYIDTMFYYHIEENLSIDLSNPLKNLIYNKVSNTVEIFNSRWGSLTKLNLDKLRIFEPSLVKFASDKTIWILDKSDNNLYKVNESGIKTYTKTNPFYAQNQFYFPTELIDFKTNVIAIDTLFGIFILDDYGNLIQSIPLTFSYHIFQLNSSIYISLDNKLIQYKLDEENKLQRQREITLPQNTRVVSIEKLRNNILILLDNKRLYLLENAEKLFFK